uniref:PRRP protein n=1 Tax=Sphenodon punctatus TaxID=8508 RepID=A0A8D0GAJ0_SPHPU
MWHSAWWSHPCQVSSQPHHSKLATVYILVLLVSLSCTSGQRQSFNHQIGNRSPEIDPFWYVGRGVRPIGRFGKRHLKSSPGNEGPGISSLGLILNAMWEHEALMDESSKVWWFKSEVG